MVSVRGIALEQKILLVLAIFLVTIAGGTFMFRVLENLPWGESFALTFGSALGHGIQEKFHTGTIALSVFIAVIIWACAWIAFESTVEYISEKKAREITEGKRARRVAAKMRGHFIVVGAGRVGTEICQKLKERKKQVVVVDMQSEVAQRLEEKGFTVIKGDVTDEHVLEQAGVRQASTIITAMGNDAQNIFVTLSAKELNPRIRVIARAEKHGAVHKLRQAGADEVIMPALLGAQKMFEAAAGG
ncbi:NAD-binding protein [Candidatus Micrarchaeota archaeon]|nr:NAD-binding protein [Candidatus Micrarchaeota archaeon]